MNPDNADHEVAIALRSLAKWCRDRADALQRATNAAAPGAGLVVPSPVAAGYLAAASEASRRADRLDP